MIKATMHEAKSQLSKLVERALAREEVILTQRHSADSRRWENGTDEAGNPTSMKILLDTHAIVWVMNDSPRLGDSVRAALLSSRNEVYVSAASIWEAAMKFRLASFPNRRCSWTIRDAFWNRWNSRCSTSRSTMRGLRVR